MQKQKYASRAGEKLEFALKSFNVEVNDLICADFGSSTGGFVDCLLQNGAKKVYAVETGYGLLDWKLRNDGRVVVMEKTNAVYVELPEKVDLITIDAGWTKQSVILPSASKNLKDGGRVISLVKLSFEAGGNSRQVKWSKRLDLNYPKTGNPDLEQDATVQALLQKVTKDVLAAGFSVVDSVKSPILGAKGKNVEYLYLLEKIVSASVTT